jgi:dTDP-4-dehydrorhamnose reductase
MLGKQIEEELKDKNIPFYGTDKEVDIRSISILEEFVKDKNINWIINCAAYTAVDKAEEEEDVPYLLNAKAVESIAKAAKQINAKLIHFSTDYVFNGEKQTGYTEQDLTNPRTVYGKTKLAGELKILENLKEFFIFRISWLYGIYGHNFVKTMMRLFKEKDKINVVDDQIGSPTYTGQLAENIIDLVQKESNKFGIYHYSDEGKISWYDFAVKIKELLMEREFDFHNSNLEIHPVTSNKYPTIAHRPKYSLLDKSKVKSELAFQLLPWEENLEKYIEKEIEEKLNI